MNQAFDTLLDFNECAIVGEVRNFTEQAGALRVTTGQAGPWIVAQLLDAQRNAVFLLIVFEYFSSNLLTDCEYFGWVTHTTPCEVGNVQQAIDATEVNECAVVGDVLDDTGNHGALFQGFHQLLTLFAHRGFDDSAARQHHVVAFAVKLDDLEFHRLAFKRRGVLDRAGIDQRTREECANAVGQHGQAAFDLAIDGTSDDLARLHRFFKREPRGETFRLVARQDGVAKAVFERFDCDGNEIAYIDFEFAIVVLEFFDGNKGFGFQAGVDDHEIVVETNDFSRNHLTGAHVLTQQRFLKESGKTFHTRCRGCRNYRHRCKQVSQF